MTTATEKTYHEVGEIKKTNNGETTWKCTEASCEMTPQGWFMHYYVFQYIKKNGKMGSSTWTIVGRSINLKHYYSR